MYPEAPPLHNGQQGEIPHYMAGQTGGQYLTAPPEGYGAALEWILMLLHFRYELGFIPPAIDGKRHQLKVELTKDAHQKYKGIRLRFRPLYIPVPEPPAWAKWRGSSSGACPWSGIEALPSAFRYRGLDMPLFVDFASERTLR
jgi:hypothetical protein